jgi:hypothetical protein
MVFSDKSMTISSLFVSLFCLVLITGEIRSEMPLHALFEGSSSQTVSLMKDSYLLLRIQTIRVDGQVVLCL